MTHERNTIGWLDDAQTAIQQAKLRAQGSDPQAAHDAACFLRELDQQDRNTGYAQGTLAAARDRLAALAEEQDETLQRMIDTYCPRKE